MDANMWFIIAIVGFSLAGVLFVAAVFMFIKMNIPAIINDLSGKAAERGVKAIRETNSANSAKLSKTGRTDRGPLGGRIVRDADALKKMHASKRLDRTDEIGMTPTEELSSADATAVLGDANATEVLGGNETEVLGGTNDLSGGTTVLGSDAQIGQVVDPVPFEVTYSQIFIHTNEVIE